ENAFGAGAIVLLDAHHDVARAAAARHGGLARIARLLQVVRARELVAGDVQALAHLDLPGVARPRAQRERDRSLAHAAPVIARALRLDAEPYGHARARPTH